MADQLDHFDAQTVVLLKGAVAGAVTAFGFVALAGMSAVAVIVDAIIPQPPVTFAVVTTALVGFGLLTTSRRL